LSAEIIKREFLYKEGLGCIETIVDNPLESDKFDSAKVAWEYVKAEQYTLGALMMFLNENNKMILTVSNKEDINAIRTIGEAAVELAEALDTMLPQVEEAAEAEPEEDETPVDEVN
jgi:hypothetical protein